MGINLIDTSNKQKKALLVLTGINYKTIVCQFCGEKLTLDTCSITYPIKTDKGATIMCSKLKCIQKYFYQLETEHK
jgi:hypothetical protein